MRLAIGYDSAGEPLARPIIDYVGTLAGVTIEDLSAKAVGATEFYAQSSKRVAEAVLKGDYDRAILICGTGIGVCISANKIPGIRAALTHDVYSAGKASTSNNAQIITMGARVIGPEHAKMIVKAWLDSQFDPNGASAENVAAINQLDG